MSHVEFSSRAQRMLVRNLAIATVLAVSTPAMAQSGWQQRAEPGTEKAEKRPQPKSGQAAGAKVKSQPVEPSTAPATALPGSQPTLKPSIAVPLGASTAPASSTFAKGAAGTDPAYEAFDQGQYLTALTLAEKLAAAGDPQAHTLIGRIHAEGLGVPQSAAMAAQWYAKAVELGDIEAAFALGTLHARGKAENGAGLERNYAEAARLFEIAAAKEHALANYSLGLLFLRGQGKGENPHRAFAHIRYAAWKGIVAAQYDLGTMFATGTGTDPNAFEAARWVEKAAKAGHAEAEIEYAVILFKVDAPPENPNSKEIQLQAEKRGAALFRSAADKGYPVAQNRLARCYSQGKGVEKSSIESAKWHLIAKAGGVEDEVLEDLYKKLAKPDKLKAEKAADDWRDKSQIQ